MKKIIIICILVNVIICSFIGYFLLFQKDNEVKRMIDVTNLTKEKSEYLLNEYELEFIEINSENEKNTVVYTIPKVNELTQKNQLIKIYISSGSVDEYYENLVNQYYEEKLDYIEYLENKKINVIIEKQISDNYPDGLIISQSTNGILKQNDTIILVVNYCEPLYSIPNFIGKTEDEVLEYLSNNDFNIVIIYEEFNTDNKVFKQSIEPNSLVLKGTMVYVYISI